MTDERIAVVAVTRSGSTLAARIAASLTDARAYVPARFAQEIGGVTEAYEMPTSALTASLFPSVRGLVFVLAVGAVVRLIAPLLGDKRTDPAVVSVDDGGRFAVALLSGHLGGANVLATQVAEAIGATSVVTTASDAHGLPAADLIGREHGWRIERMGELKSLAAALVNGDPVGIYQDAGEPDWHRGSLPDSVTRHNSVAALLDDGPPAAIVISDRELPSEVERPGWVWYRPRTLMLGIGCSRGASVEEIDALVGTALAAHELSRLSVAEVASIDLKSVEPGLRAFAQGEAVPLRFYSAVELDSVPGQMHSSAVVFRAVGTHGVCEPAALLAAGATTLLVPKQKSRSVTVAIARRTFAGEER